MNAAFVQLFDNFTNALPRLPQVLVTFLIGYLCIIVIGWVMVASLKVARVPRALIAILKSLASIILWVILVAQLLRILGLSQIAITLSGSLLVIGLAIANGAQLLVSDVISGLFLARDPDFGIGYHIKVDDVDGIVEAIDIRRIRIRTKEGTLYIIPNSVLDKEKWHLIDKPSRKAKPATIHNEGKK